MFKRKLGVWELSSISAGSNISSPPSPSREMHQDEKRYCDLIAEMSEASSNSNYCNLLLVTAHRQKLGAMDGSRREVGAALSNGPSKGELFANPYVLHSR